MAFLRADGKTTHIIITHLATTLRLFDFQFPATFILRIVAKTVWRLVEYSNLALN